MNILVVDDSVVIRRAIQAEVEARGDLKATLADGGAAALKLISENDFDLITLDVEMPKMDGFEVCKAVRALSNAKKANTPIIFITGRDDLKGRQAGFKAGATDFILKGEIQDHLYSMITKNLKPENSLKGMKALVVDDSATIRFILKKALLEHSVEVITAEDGIEAFEYLLYNADSVDMVITDQDMPNLSGIGLTEKIRKELGLKDLPIMLVSADGTQETVLEFFRVGGTDSLRKPVLKEELYARLVVHLQGVQLRKKLAEHVSELNELNSVKDQYLAVCSHDMKSPLNAILGYVDLVLDEINDEMIVKDLGQVKKAASLLVDMVNELLDVNRMQAKKDELSLEPEKISEIAEVSYNIADGFAQRKGVELCFEKGELKNEPNIRANKTELTRVVNNLLSNALKFTPKGGRVTLGIVASESAVELFVKDSGVGMTQDQMEHLFEQYTSSSRSGTDGEKGTGLGMVISKEIVELHGGELELESEVGQGTTVHFKIPA